jgi:hypothetical protein
MLILFILLLFISIPLILFGFMKATTYPWPDSAAYYVYAGMLAGLIGLVGLIGIYVINFYR